MIAVIVPPSIMTSSTVTSILIIVIISGAKFHVVEWVSHKRISSYSIKASNSQWILSTATSYLELLVVEMGPGLVFKLKVNPQLPLASLCEAT